jgi:hypothetical protein
METKHLMNKHGARITAIHSVAHDTFRGVADWFYVGDLEWKDGGKSLASEIPPWAVCFDHDNQAAHAEYATISERMNEYLKTHGAWHDVKFMKDGRAVSWTPKQKKGNVPL